MNHGRDSIYIRMDDDEGVSGAELFQIANSRFCFNRLGHSFRCTEMEAALGIAQLEERDMSCARRQKIAADFNEGLSDLEEHLQLPRPRPDSEHAYMFYSLAIKNPQVRRDELILYLEEHGIETRYLLPLINQPIYRELFGNLDGQYPVAKWLNDTAFYIGCHPGMSDNDVSYIVKCFHQYFGGRQ
jgi:dTDP-4-amino-4,6-dideoxygalactose transaminase